MSPLLSAQHIAKSFNVRHADILPVLANIGLTLRAGEIVCLLGASGCGKTTLLRILAGLDAVYTGEIVSELARPGPTSGYLSQSDRLLPWRTALDNVSLGLELLGSCKKEARLAAHSMLAKVGLDGSAHCYPSELSGGMQQRALLARTLVLSPKLLLLDEPTSSLDVPARRDLAAVIKTYTLTTNAATLIVTHSVEEACFLADRILLISRAPASVMKEISLTDVRDHPGPALGRDNALDTVMTAFCDVLEQTT